MWTQVYTHMHQIIYNNFNKIRRDVKKKKFKSFMILNQTWLFESQNLFLHKISRKTPKYSHLFSPLTLLSFCKGSATQQNLCLLLWLHFSSILYLDLSSTELIWHFSKCINDDYETITTYFYVIISNIIYWEKLTTHSLPNNS